MTSEKEVGQFGYVNPPPTQFECYAPPPVYDERVGHYMYPPPAASAVGYVQPPPPGPATTVRE